MKGIVRRFDTLGRIVVPKELRKALNIKEGDPIEISAQGRKIILEPSSWKCAVCGADGEAKINGVCVCQSCAEEFYSSYRRDTK